MSDEEKEALEILKSFEPDDLVECAIYLQALERITNLIEKQQKEIEELKKENLEIRDWKYVIDSPIDLDKLKELDLIKIKGKEYVSKDKIKAGIEESELLIDNSQGCMSDEDLYKEYGKIEFGQSLLEKE